MHIDELTDLDHGQSNTIHGISSVVGYESSLASTTTGVTANATTAATVSANAVPQEPPHVAGGGAASIAPASAEVNGGVRQAPLRVDAQRNLEHVLRAAREVFGESGYGAPMEDVARRARVGVGTVYRRFPSKEVLVNRIAQEETARLAEQARAALAQEGEAWTALERFLRSSVASGAGRLLPPSVLAGQEVPARPDADERAQVSDTAGNGAGGEAFGTKAPDSSARQLLTVVSELARKAREAGKLRADVSVGDVLLVIATAAPSLPDLRQRSAASERLLDILLEGLRAGHVR